MKYILVVGLTYKKYKEPGQVIIYSGDRMIDHFELRGNYPGIDLRPDHLNPEHIKKYGLQMPKMTDGMDIPNLYKVYKLEENELGQDMQIIVKNSSNNYTNGFMTKTSLIKFPIIAFFPETMAQNNCDILASRIDRLYYVFKKALDRQNDPRFKDMPSVERNNLSTLPEQQYFPHAHWPSLHWLKVTAMSKNVQDGLHRTLHWLGGDFKIQMNIKRKHGIKFLHTPGTKTHGIWQFFNMFFLISGAKNLLNIYNEDQRSNNT